jgi:hypothetical protein
MKMIVGTYTGPASYASGGEDLTATILATLRCRQIYSLTFSPLVRASTGAQVPVAFDHNVSGASQGKIRIGIGGGGGSVPAHTHDLLVKGGQIGSTTNDVATYATNILGKEQATDVTIAGVDSATKGGVLASTAAAGTVGAEIAAATDLHLYTGRFVLIGN